MLLLQTQSVLMVSGRMADVFGGVGSGQVKADKDDLKRMIDSSPDFDQQQMNRSGLQLIRMRLSSLRGAGLIIVNLGRGGRRGRDGGGKMPGFKKESFWQNQVQPGRWS